MISQTVKFFGKKASDLYQSILDESGRHAGTVQSSDMSEGDVVLLSEKILNNVFKYPQIRLSEAQPTLKTEEISISDARRVFSNFSFDISSRSIQVSEVKYVIDFSGSKDTLMLSVDGRELEKLGFFAGNSLVLMYYFQGVDADAHAPLIKKNKDEMLSKLRINNEELKEFFESRKPLLLASIRISVENKVRSNAKYQSDLSKF